MVKAWHGHGMVNVNQTRPHCVNQVGKTHSKPLAARHGRGTVWARHAMYESTFKRLMRAVYGNIKYCTVHYRGGGISLQAFSLHCT